MVWYTMRVGNEQCAVIGITGAGSWLTGTEVSMAV